MGGGVAKRLSYLISLFSKSDDEGGGGQKSQNIDDIFYELPITVNFKQKPDHRSADYYVQ